MSIRCGFCASPDARALHEGSTIGICRNCLLAACIAWEKSLDEVPVLDVEDFARMATKYEPLLQNATELGCFVACDGNFEADPHPLVPNGTPRRKAGNLQLSPILRRIK